MHAPTVSLAATSHVRTRSDALARAVLAGFMASLAMLLTFLIAYNLTRLLSGAAIFEPVRTWLTNLSNNRLIDASLSDVYLAAGVYLTGGLLWAIVYTAVEHRLPGTPLKRGVLFAMLPAFVSLVVVLPLMGAGLFGIGLGAGPLPVIGNVLLHVVYGAILGVVCGPFGDRDASTLDRPSTANGGASNGSYEPIAALALVGGLVLGGALGLLATLTGAHLVTLPQGESSFGFILWGALLGGVAGLFVGSFAGLSRSTPRRFDT